MTFEQLFFVEVSVSKDRRPGLDVAERLAYSPSLFSNRIDIRTFVQLLFNFTTAHFHNGSR